MPHTEEKNMVLARYGEHTRKMELRQSQRVNLLVRNYEVSLTGQQLVGPGKLMYTNMGTGKQNNTKVDTSCVSRTLNP